LDVATLSPATRRLKTRAILTTLYAAGLRVSELCHLQVTDIDSARMVLCVRQGKGQRDRCVMLSTRLLALLRQYWQRDKPRPWLFPGHDRSHPMARKTVYLLCREAGVKAQLSKAVYPHLLRNASTYCYTSLICIDFTRLAIRGCADIGPVWHPIELSISPGR